MPKLPDTLPATFASLCHTQWADIVLRLPTRVDQGDCPATVSGRAMTPAPRWDGTGPRKLTASMRRQADWLRDNARAEAKVRGLYCTIGDGYSDNGLVPSDALEARLILWGELVVLGCRVGPPERWDTRGGMSVDQVLACPPLITEERKTELLLALATNGPMPEWATRWTKEAA